VRFVKPHAGPAFGDWYNSATNSLVSLYGGGALAAGLAHGIRATRGAVRAYYDARAIPQRLSWENVDWTEYRTNDITEDALYPAPTDLQQRYAHDLALTRQGLFGLYPGATNVQLRWYDRATPFAVPGAGANNYRLHWRLMDGIWIESGTYSPSSSAYTNELAVPLRATALVFYKNSGATRALAVTSWKA
jgi:hypothetical protein